MKKVIVIGCPGSGKSTLSIALSEITGLPLYHLDMMYWNANRTTVEKSVFMQRLTQALEKDEWIIDGNYASTIEMRLSACDTVVFLDYPTDACVDGIRKRRGRPRQDMPWVEKEDEEDAELLEFVVSYNDTSRPKLLELLSNYPEKSVIILKNRDEAQEFLNNICIE